MTNSTTDKAQTIRRLLETEGDAVRQNATHFNQGRIDAAARFTRWEQAREEARDIKEHAIEHLPDLIDQVTTAVEANGGHVHLAADAASANTYIERVVRDADAKVLVKSKSMTTEEIEVNHHLEALGVDVYETDLGEFVIQLADETPSHLIGPAIHKSREDIAALFNDRFDPDPPLETPEELTRFARDYLGEQIHQADIGMTGANFVLAETGTIVLVTNEGNARKSAVTPDTHIAVAGVEKLIPSVRDLGPFVELIARTGTGQDIAQYVTLLTPPVPTPPIDFDAPDTPNFGGRVPPGESGASEREFHLVLLDNGRLTMRDDPDLRETLYCIRCGACANSCANFQHVGGHAFGGETYTGGIATGWEAGIYGLDTAAGFNDLCTGCTRCVTACPVKIDIPWINTVVRDRVNQTRDPGRFGFLVDGLTPDDEPAGLDLAKRAFGNFGTLARLGSTTAPVSNWLATRPIVRALLDRWVGIDRRRPLPRFERETLRDWYTARGSHGTGEAGTVVLYPDVYTNHAAVDRGKATVRALEALGIEVTIPDVTESGRAPLSQGMVTTARARAHAVHDALADSLADGVPILVIEPSDLMMFRRDYERLLPKGAFEALATQTYEVFEYLADHPRLPEYDTVFTPGDNRNITYHAHCQQRTLGLDTPTIRVLEALGYDVTTSDVECCGMAGSFGYKSEYYELSMAVGESLATDLDQDHAVVASGTSCVEQLTDLLGTRVPHPIELLTPPHS